MKYYRFNARAKYIHLESGRDQHKTWFPCGRWKFTHRIDEVSRPDSIDAVCKGCRKLYDVYEYERQAFNDDVMSDLL